MTAALVDQIREKTSAPPVAVRGWPGWLKDALYLAYLYCGWVQLRDTMLNRLGRARAVIVAYHRVGACDVLTRPTARFREDLDYYRRHFDVVTLAEFCKRLRQRRRRPCLAITFDDGYRDNFTEAVPALADARLSGTFFVATGFIGGERVFPHDARGQDEDDPALRARFPKLSWDEVRAMQAAGHEIGSHTVNHVNLGQADRDQVASELQVSLVDLERELGRRPRAFAFPWGKLGDVGQHAMTTLRQAGYYAAVLAYGGVNTARTDWLRLQRVDVGNGRLSRLAVRARVRGLDVDYWRHRGPRADR